MRSLASKPIRFRVAGTVDDPQLRMPENGAGWTDWLAEIAAHAMTEDSTAAQNPMEGIVDNLIRGDEAPDIGEWAALLNELRKRRAEWRESNVPDEGAAGTTDEETEERPGIFRRWLRRREADPDR